MPTSHTRTLLNYRTGEGREPFQEWLRGLKDAMGRAVIRVRLNRVQMGNLGNCRSVGHGVFELKIAFGPGYRVYFGEHGDEIVLLTGGDKNTQTADIRKAKEYWRDYDAEENQ